MTAPDLSRLVTAFFVRHLAVEHNASPHTTKAYRGALKLLLRFAADACHRPVVNTCPLEMAMRHHASYRRTRPSPNDGHRPLLGDC